MSIHLKDIKAVIFDMDGVLVDTMGFHYEAWRRTFKKLGVKVTKKEIYLREGERWGKTLWEILKRNSIKVTGPLKKDAFAYRQYIFKKIFKVKMFKGSEKLLKELKKRHIALGLATGTPREELRRILPKRIYQMFDAIMPSDEVRRGKPHPEPYLKALRKLRVNPDEALVIENAPHGIEAASRAGIRCLAIETSLPKIYLKGAYKVFSSIKNLSKFLLESPKIL